MIELVSWNIQWGRGMDGVVDLARIVDTVMAIGDPDIICFQEVTRNLPALAGNDGADQPAVIAGLLPGFEAVYGPGTDLAGEGPQSGRESDQEPGQEPGSRRQFGNMVLSRFPVAQVMAHLLPRPSVTGGHHLQRQALEVIVETPGGPLRVVTTHLEYYAAAHRLAQVDRLRQLHREAFSHPLKPASENGTRSLDILGEPPFGPVPTLLCGDFNLDPEDQDYGRILAPFDGGTPPFADAWSTLHPGLPHPVTSKQHTVNPPACLDYVFVTPDLAGRLRTVEVDGDTTASDHQPIHIVLET